MVRVVRHSDAASFRERTMAFLMEAEAEHNVILGITDRILRRGTNAYDSIFLAHVETEGGEVLAAVMRTAPHGAMLSKVKDQVALPPLCEALAAAYDTLPAVQGAAADADLFAQLWQQHSGQAHHLKMEQGVYVLTEVKQPQNVKGECRRMTRTEFERVVDWRVGFTEGVALGTEERSAAEQYVEARMNEAPTLAIYLWWDGGEPVSMAAGTRHTPNGGIVSLVYTPPEKRRNGYASAITAAVSQVLLDNGRTFCCLHTDLSNPTSNKIYQAIGYEPISNQRLIEFEN